MIKAVRDRIPDLQFPDKELTALIVERATGAGFAVDFDHLSFSTKNPASILVEQSAFQIGTESRHESCVAVYRSDTTDRTVP